MDSVARALVVYAFLLVIFRIAGKRALSDVTTFDLVLTLIVSEAIQQALIDGDDSLTNAFLVVLTLVGANVGLSMLKTRSPRLDRLIDGQPLLLVAHGRAFEDRMRNERVDADDILMAARDRGVERMAQIKYAVLERGGSISIIEADEDANAGEEREGEATGQ